MTRRPFTVLLAAATGTFTVDLTLPSDVTGVDTVRSNLDVTDLRLRWVLGTSAEVPISYANDGVCLPLGHPLDLPAAAHHPPVASTSPVLRITGTVTVPIGGGAYLTFTGPQAHRTNAS